LFVFSPDFIGAWLAAPGRGKPALTKRRYPVESSINYRAVTVQSRWQPTIHKYLESYRLEGENGNVKKILALLALALVVLVTLAAVIPAQAQDGLSDDERALADRAQTALRDARAYTTFIEHSLLVIKLSIGDAEINPLAAVEGTTTHEVNAFHVVGDVPNLRANARVTMNLYTLLTENMSRTLDAEIRVVDGVLYVNATRQTDPPEDEELYANAPMPEGWTLVENLDDWPALDILFLDNFTPGDDPNVYMDIRDLSDDVFALASAVSSESVTLDDGTAVEAITLEVTGENLRELIRRSSEAGNDLELGMILGDLTLLDQLNDAASILSVTVYVDDQGWLRQVDITLRLDMPAPQNATEDQITWGWDITGTYEFSAINEPIEPVAAPQM
jgi:hypothetical protein